MGVRDDWIRNLSNLVVLFILGDVLPTIDGLADGCAGLMFDVFNQVAGMGSRPRLWNYKYADK